MDKLKWYETLDDEGNKRLNIDLILKRSLLGIIVILILIASGVFLISYWGWPTILPASEIGDAFGVANTLFSALAFALLIYTSLLQREELKETKEELKLTRIAGEKHVQLIEAQIRNEKLRRDREVMPDLIVSISTTPHTVSFSAKFN